MEAEKAEAKPWLEKLLNFFRPAFVLIGLILLFLLIRKIAVGNFVRILSDLSPAWVLAALAAWGLNLCAAVRRFQSLAAPEVSYSRVLEIYLMAYLLNYASMIQGAGIGAKVGLLKGERVEAARSLAGSGAEVIYDFIFTSAVALAFALIATSETSEVWPIGAIALIGVLLAFILSMLGRRGGFWGRFGRGFISSFRPRRFILNLLLTSLLWCFAALFYYFTIRAGGGVLNPLLPLAAVSAGFVAGIISLIPGGLGVKEITYAYVCSLSGIPLEEAGTAALITRALGIIFVAAFIGGLSLWRMMRRS